MSDIKIRQQTKQIFDLAENPIMEFITKFLDEPHSLVFTEDIIYTTEPLILLPIDEYKKDKYIRFNLKVIKNSEKKNDKKRLEYLNDIVQYQGIKEALGFVLYCVKTVLPSVVGSSMINNKPLLNINLELDEVYWVFKPVHINDNITKKKFFEDSIEKIKYIKSQNHEIPDNMKKEMDMEYENIVNELDKLNITPDMIEMDKKLSESYTNNYVIAIVADEITKDQLPKPKFNTSDYLPKISENTYEDPK